MHIYITQTDLLSLGIVKEEKEEEGKRGWVSNGYHLVIGSICTPTLAFPSSPSRGVQSAGGDGETGATQLLPLVPVSQCAKEGAYLCCLLAVFNEMGKRRQDLGVTAFREKPPLVLILLYQWPLLLRFKTWTFQFLCWHPIHYFHHQSLRLKCYPYYSSHMKNLYSQ